MVVDEKGTVCCVVHGYTWVCLWYVWTIHNTITRKVGWLLTWTLLFQYQFREDNFEKAMMALSDVNDNAPKGAGGKGKANKKGSMLRSGRAALAS